MTDESAGDRAAENSAGKVVNSHVQQDQDQTMGPPKQVEKVDLSLDDDPISVEPTKAV